MSAAKRNEKIPESKAEKKGYDDAPYRRNTALNLETIRSRTGWTRKRLAEEMGISQSIMTEYARGDRLPSLSALLVLDESTEVQRKIPFTLDDFVKRDIRESGADFGGEMPRSSDGRSHQDILGTYNLYFFDQKLQEVGGYPLPRKLRYGLISFYETARRSGGVIVLAFARFFKTEDEVRAFRGELESAPFREEQGREDQIALYRSCDDVYTGSVALSGSHIFVNLFSSLHNDQARIILTAPEKRPGAEYIGGLGNVLSVTRGAEHVPVAQKIILSRRPLVASDEEIASQLLYGNVKIDVEGEVQALLTLLEAFYSPAGRESAVGEFLDAADIRAIFRQRLERLILNNVRQNFNGLCLVSKQDDHACYLFLKKHAKR